MVRFGIQRICWNSACFDGLSNKLEGLSCLCGTMLVHSCRRHHYCPIIHHFYVTVARNDHETWQVPEAGMWASAWAINMWRPISVNVFGMMWTINKSHRSSSESGITEPVDCGERHCTINPWWKPCMSSHLYLHLSRAGPLFHSCTVVPNDRSYPLEISTLCEGNTHANQLFFLCPRRNDFFYLIKDGDRSQVEWRRSLLQSKGNSHAVRDSLCRQ